MKHHKDDARLQRLKAIAVDVLDAGVVPRVHGNGFIQFDVPGHPNARLHVWHPDVPRQKNSTPIHDHTYSFYSTILAGELINITYLPSYESRGMFLAYQAVPRNSEDTVLELSSNTPRTLNIVKAKLYRKGESYFFDAFKFHEAKAVQAFTFMNKVDISKGAKPTVYIHKDEKPDNDFDRYTAGDKRELIRIAKAVLGA